ncbi:MAG: RNA polymerase sigma factor [Bryobacteraceae bacterium]|nr:RNA polymerase sigma factor [Bryobacteraceae bacterium]
MDFHELYERYARDIGRYAFYLSGNRADAEDIVAETFSRVWLAAGEIRAATVKGYLTAIARNYFLETRRKRKRETAMPAREPGAAPLPEIEEALDAIGRLPELERETILMRAAAGLSYDEIAEAFRISPAAARVRVHRARQLLNQLLERENV